VRRGPRPRVQQHEQRSRRLGIVHRGRAREQPEVAGAVGAEAHLGQIGLVLVRQVAVVRVEGERTGRDAELAGRVLERRIDPVGLGDRGLERVFDLEAVVVLTVVGAVGVEDVVLVDELATRVVHRAAEAGQATGPVGEVAVHRARRIVGGPQRREGATAGRDGGSEDGDVGGLRGGCEQQRQGDQDESATHARRTRLAPPRLRERGTYCEQAMQSQS
jgi:hypothetical protein